MMRTADILEVKPKAPTSHTVAVTAATKQISESDGKVDQAKVLELDRNRTAVLEAENA